MTLDVPLMETIGRSAARIGGAGLALSFCVLYFWHVFRLSTAEPYTTGLGDWIDPYLINALLEHWYASLRHFTSPASPIMFHPAAGTIGYSHSLVLYAPIYVVLRLVTGPFQAYTFTLFMVLASGSFCLYLVCRSFGLSVLEALLASALFATSANVTSPPMGVWSQRGSVFLIPMIVLLAVHLPRLRGRSQSSGAFAVALLSVLLLAHDFYTGAFAALLAALVLIPPWLFSQSVRRRTPRIDLAMRTFSAPVPAAKRPHPIWLVAASASFVLFVLFYFYPLDRTELGHWRFSVRSPWRLWHASWICAAWYFGWRWRILTRLRRAISAFAEPAPAIAAHPSEAPALFQYAVARAGFAGAAAGVLVFGWFYIRSYLEHPAFPEGEVLNHLKSIDPANWHSVSAAFAELTGYASVRPFLLVVVLSFLTCVPQTGIDRSTRVQAAWALVVTALVFLWRLRYGSLSIWSVTVGWLPGLSAIRDPGRVIYVYELAAALLAAGFLARARTRRPARVIATLSMTALLVMTWNWPTLEYKRPIQVFERWVAAPIAIPPSCRSFFVLGASNEYMSRSDHPASLYGIDAAFIAFRYGLPTLNGYSAFAPPDWELGEPHGAEYLDQVRRWVARADLRDVCALDIETRQIVPFETAEGREP